MKKLMTLLLPIFILGACSHGDCRSEKKRADAKQAGVAVMDGSSAERVKVAKADGSLQCGQGQKIAATEMQKDLKDIKVYSSSNKNDGMMRIQLCGSPTGNYNVYEIDRKDLDAAIKAGFKEWTVE
ncbi:MAG: hypothetical protein J7501_18135 [Bdellovibrio sp.]|nr:hypothetical protein [Bdellovibrio sp.]